MKLSKIQVRFLAIIFSIWQSIKGCYFWQYPNRVSIVERLAVVTEKSRLVDWEINTMIGKKHQGAFVTIAERVSKFTLIKKMDSKHADGVPATTIALPLPYSDNVSTINPGQWQRVCGT